MSNYDVIIIGAGAAGLAAAGVASRTRRVAIIDMGQLPGRKVAISGGGRCNFTNAAVAANRYFGENPDFVRGAISRTTPSDILDWAASLLLRIAAMSQCRTASLPYPMHGKVSWPVRKKTR